MADSVHKGLLEALAKIDRPAAFCASGVLPPILPGLTVEGVGLIALPLAKSQALSLKKSARQAPYGKGTRTLVDTNVRRVWEVDADRVTLANPEWGAILGGVVRSVQAQLGLEKRKLEAHLYKLLIYEPGSFFLAHQDGEKLDGMVATLVIALPSAHQGGVLIVRHEGREQAIDFSPQSEFLSQYAAFYADCEHEVQPVTGGFRLALVYNLTLEKPKQKVTAPSSGAHIRAVAGLLERWKESRPVGKAGGEPAKDAFGSKLAVILDHEYSQSGLAYDGLKGIDRAKADVMFAAARQADCDASLALVTKWVSGSAEPSGDYGYGSRRSRRRGRYRYDDEDEDQDGGEHEMGEVYDESLIAEHFTDADGNRLAFDQIPLRDNEIVSKAPLSSGKPDREDFEGYTGNAGMTLERWYHRAAVLIWPARARFDVLCEAGVSAAVGGLEQMVQRWGRAGERERTALHQQCFQFASRIIDHWPPQPFASGQYGEHNYAVYDDVDYHTGDDEDLDDQDSEVSHNDPDEGDADDRPDSRRTSLSGPRDSCQLLLSLLGELGDIALISACLRGVVAKDASVEPGRTLGDLCQKHGWTTFQDELRELFENSTNETLDRDARLLADLALRPDQDAERRALCADLARHIMSSVERWNPYPPKRDWRASSVNLGHLLSTLVQAFIAAGESESLARLLKYVLDRPKPFELTNIVVPALMRLERWLKQAVTAKSPPMRKWILAINAELNSRVSNPPRKPADWRRESDTGCACADCQQLSQFLQNATAQTLRLPLVTERRQHIHQIIDRKKLDTTHVTERRGRPYTLVCTKTNGSHERALRSHQVDQEHLKFISKLMAWHEGLPTTRDSVDEKTPKRGQKRKK